MKKPEHEIVTDGEIEAVDPFEKEFTGSNIEAQNGIQEVWESGLEVVKNVKNHRKAGDM